MKDRVDKGELTIEYCPTSEMLADYFTKPLQGSLFRKMRSVIMGWEHVNVLKEDYESRLDKERVAKSILKSQEVSNHDVTTQDKRTYAQAVKNIKSSKE